MNLYLIRGLPGSGKSTYARRIGCFHVEADMYHCRNGEYAFDICRQKLAHAWCFRLAADAMSNGLDVVVSNTFTQRWEMQPYIDHANITGHNVKIIRMTNDYGTVHNVPELTKQKMRDRFEPIEGEIIYDWWSEK